MPWPEYDSSLSKWGDPATFKPQEQNLDIREAITAFNDIVLSRNENNGIAGLGANGLTNISQHPQIFFSFWFNPGNGNIVNGIDAEGKNIAGTLPPGFNFTKVEGVAVYFLDMPAGNEIISKVLVTSSSSLQFAMTSHVLFVSSQRVRIRLITHAVGTTGVRTVDVPPVGSYVGVTGWAANDFCRG